MYLIKMFLRDAAVDVFKNIINMKIVTTVSNIEDIKIFDDYMYRVVRDWSAKPGTPVRI